MKLFDYQRFVAVSNAFRFFFPAFHEPKVFSPPGLGFSLFPFFPTVTELHVCCIGVMAVKGEIMHESASVCLE